MRVVLVDPSRTMRLYVTRLLEAGGHEVKPCADGPQALACMRADPEIAAVIASGELASSMSGLELCWETRVLAGRDRPIYVILMSSNIDKKKLGEALDSGADDFISKPPVPDELYARLRAAERLTTMQHDHHDLTVSTMHAHLDHENCIETVILRGPTAEVTTFAQSVMSQTGVRHGKFHPIPVVAQNGKKGAHVHLHPHA